MLLVAVAAALLAAPPAPSCDGQLTGYRARGRRFRRVSREHFRSPVGTELTGKACRSCSSRAQ
jgi:hypothetical protein